MSDIDKLINKEDPFLPLLQEWIEKAKNKIEILPRDEAKAKDALLKIQVTTRSALGCIIYETGGVLIEDGWIRLLGSGSDRMHRSLPEWNKGKSYNNYGEVATFLIVADDVVGGIYAINGGMLGDDQGNMYYHAPESLEWIPMGIGYTDFLLFCFDYNLDDFYADVRWQSWREDVKALHPDKAFSCFPFLWTAEAADMEQVSRRAVDVDELYELNMDMKNKNE